MSLYRHFPKSSRNEPDARSMRERCDIECARRGRVTSIATRSPAASPPLLLREPTPRSLSALSPQTRSSGRAGIRGLWLSLRRIGSDRRLSRDFASHRNTIGEHCVRGSIISAEAERRSIGAQSGTELEWERKGTDREVPYPFVPSIFHISPRTLTSRPPARLLFSLITASACQVPRRLVVVGMCHRAVPNVLERRHHHLSKHNPI